MKKNYVNSFIFLCLVGMQLSAQAMPFGVSDSRTLGMGGVGVATATSLNASFFNPAMLAQYKVRKELARNASFTAPPFDLYVRYSKTLEELDNFHRDDLDGQLSSAIANFNASTTVSEAQNLAQPVISSSQQLQAGLDKLTKGPFALDANFGFAIGIGGNLEGGALMINFRTVGDGVIVETPEDRALVQKYIATVSYFAETGTVVGAPNPELFDAGGQLIDQTGNLTSSARGTLIAVAEFGMSFAHNVEWFHQQFAIGFTPKTVRVTTYDVEANATQQSLADNQDLAYDWKFNLDLGLEKQINTAWRAAAVVKNLIPQSLKTALNNEVQLNPQWRAGVAYTQHWGILAADLDLVPNDPVGAGDENQNLGIGGEWFISYPFHLLAGYQYNLKASGDHKKGLISAGFVLQSRYLHFALTYGESAAEKAGALTLAYRF